jgi:hypothetical protein
VNDQEKVHHAVVRRLDSADWTLNAAELKGSHHRVYYFGNHFDEGPEKSACGKSVWAQLYLYGLCIWQSGDAPQNNLILGIPKT